ncbi:MAG TPA: type I-C CRISPR-associated protein Cas5 [Thiothrix sp.]|nr:type I-C CRISPR-associated protein Cas5 [Thiothrix sp.]
MKTFCLEIWGDFACFTRPEMKVERVSYDVITPSAARAIFEAILWKPAIRWQIEKIEILKPIKWINLRRNEVGAVIPATKLKSAEKKGKGNLSLYIEDERKQRAGLFLKDVRYRLYAHFEMHNNATDKNPVKFAEMFKRRARKGQCFNQPYLGTREFSAHFELLEKQEKIPAIDESRDLGWMLYDMDYTDKNNPQPMFFHAQMNNGTINIPPIKSDEVRK